MDSDGIVAIILFVLAIGLLVAGVWLAFAGAWLPAIVCLILWLGVKSSG